MYLIETLNDRGVVNNEKLFNYLREMTIMDFSIAAIPKNSKSKLMRRKFYNILRANIVAMNYSIKKQRQGVAQDEQNDNIQSDVKTKSEQ